MEGSESVPPCSDLMTALASEHIRTLPEDMLQLVLCRIRVALLPQIATTSSQFAPTIQVILKRHRQAVGTLGSLFFRARLRTRVTRLRQLGILRDDLSEDQHRVDLVDDIGKFHEHLIAIYKHRRELLDLRIETAVELRAQEELQLRIMESMEESSAFEDTAHISADDSYEQLEDRVKDMFELQTRLHNECQSIKAQLSSVAISA